MGNEWLFRTQHQQEVARELAKKLGYELDEMDLTDPLVAFAFWKSLEEALLSNLPDDKQIKMAKRKVETVSLTSEERGVAQWLMIKLDIHSL